MNTECGPESRPSVVPRWVLRGWAGTWGMVVWLPLLLADPIAQAKDSSTPWASGLELALIAVTFLAVTVASHRRLQGWTEYPYLVFSMLAVQVLATVALVIGSPSSSTVFTILIIAAVVALDGPWGFAAVAAVTLLAAAVVGVAGGTSAQVVATTVTTGLSGLGCWSFRRLFFVIAELARTRETLAQLAVAQERERFSRDLHDLLGHTLSVVVVKAQAVRRLAPLDAEAAAEHAADIETIGRRALVEVRQSVDGYRGTGLAIELDRARSALLAAGITGRTTGDPDRARPVPPDVDALFGWVVREGVTNVIRHSGARTCVVAWTHDAREARLEITDDGRGPAPDRALPISGLPTGGGLAGLTDRVAAGGGRLEAGPTGDGFRLVVTVPVNA
jgi:two-component system sensor histidine kinase DesK